MYDMCLGYTLSMYNLIITAASHIKPSSSSNDHMIMDSLTEDSPDHLLLKVCELPAYLCIVLAAVPAM